MNAVGFTLDVITAETVNGVERFGVQGKPATKMLLFVHAFKANFLELSGKNFIHSGLFEKTGVARELHRLISFYTCANYRVMRLNSNNQTSSGSQR